MMDVSEASGVDTAIRVAIVPTHIPIPTQIATITEAAAAGIRDGAEAREM
jgi:hypothetical protein